MKKNSRGYSAVCLLLAILFGAAGVWMTWSSGEQVPTPYYRQQLEAAERMESCFAAIRGYREQLGIPLNEGDSHRTGVVGQMYTGITTTVGTLEAKRTTAWPDMAALCVRMLHEAGMSAGDRVALGISGSYPGMNLAAITACEAMGLEVVCISSVGASYYGANDPELTFPEMMYGLERDGLITTRSAVVSMGGDFDIGMEMDPDMADAVRERLAQCGLTLMEERDFHTNLSLREEIYGEVDCFLSVGGNWVALGEGDENLSYGRGVLMPGDFRSTQDSGLIGRYLGSGVPVLHLMDMEGILTDYGLPFDPEAWPERGTSAVYTTMQYEKMWLGIGLGGSAVLLGLCLWLGKKSWNERNSESLL